MNTLDDLRTTLAVHAPAEDAALHDRTASIRARVRTVRRRRRVSAVVGVVAAVALIIGVIALPRLASGRSDLAAPTTVTMGGFEYRLVRVVETEPGQAKLTITIPRKDAGQAVMLLADGLGGGSATLQPTYESLGQDPIDGIAGDRIVHDGANPVVPLPVYFDDAAATLRYTLTVERGSARTRVGVALYERTDRMPAGAVDPTGKLVYRQQIGSRRLLAAAFGDPGRREVTFAFTGRLDQVALESACSVSTTSYHGAQPPYINVAVDGGRPVSNGECRQTSGDVANGGIILGSSADGEHTVRVWASETQGGPPADYEGLVLGGAAYDDSGAITINGNRVDPIVEFSGRTWKLDRDAIVRSAKGARSVSYSASADRPMLLGRAADGVTGLDVSAEGVSSSAGGAAISRSAVPGASLSLGTVTLPGEKVTYTASWGWGDKDAAVAILVYRLQD